MRRVRAAAAGLGAVAVLAGCGSAGRIPVIPPAGRYYLSLGDSLAQGVQAGPLGHVRDTDRGYADQFYDLIRHSGDNDLRLVKLGCPGETTGSMIRGRHCPYPAGSQLAQAVAFLHGHRGRVPLITLDIGANDPRSCFTNPVRAPVPPCATGPAAPTAANLALILARLRTAAGPRTLIIGMTYYAPELPEWRYGPAGRARAQASERLSLAFDAELDKTYRAAGDRVADVAGAFATTDFDGRAPVRGAGLVPPSVAAICRWTWTCARPPRGPNKHPDDAGYGVIARAFLAAYRAAPGVTAPAGSRPVTAGPGLPDRTYRTGGPNLGADQVEVPAPDAAEECLPATRRERQRRAPRVLRVPDGHDARQVTSDFYAVAAVGRTVAALAPVGLSQIQSPQLVS